MKTIMFRSAVPARPTVFINILIATLENKLQPKRSSSTSVKHLAIHRLLLPVRLESKWAVRRQKSTNSQIINHLTLQWRTTNMITENRQHKMSSRMMNSEQHPTRSSIQSMTSLPTLLLAMRTACKTMTTVTETKNQLKVAVQVKWWLSRCNQDNCNRTSKQIKSSTMKKSTMKSLLSWLISLCHSKSFRQAKNNLIKMHLSRNKQKQLMLIANKMHSSRRKMSSWMVSRYQKKNT